MVKVVKVVKVVKAARGVGFKVVGPTQAFCYQLPVLSVAHECFNISCFPNLPGLELVADACFACFSKSGLMGDFFADKRLDIYVFGHSPL